MRWLKRWIARLFNIQPEDLPARPQVGGELPLGPDLKAEINQEITRQLQTIFQENILPALDRYLDERPAPVLAETKSQSVGMLDSAGSTYAALGAVQQVEASMEAEFPLVEEMVISLSVDNLAETPGVPEPNLVEAPAVSEGAEVSETEAVQVLEPSLLEEEILPLEPAQPEQPLVHVAPQLTPIEGKTLRLGIDFGTTTTAVSIKIGDDLPVALPIGADGVTRYIPSVAYFPPGDGDLGDRVIIGEGAERFGDQAFLIRSVKRCLGCSGKGCGKDGKGKAQFPWCRGDGKLQISESEFLEPTKIAYFIIREALDRAISIVRERWQLDLTHKNVLLQPLNLGCSAKFNYNQRELIRSVAEELGFSHVLIENVVEEPILAGFTFSRFAQNPYGRALIYDFGGGTFDVALLEVDRTSQGLRVAVLTTAGDNWLGGDDIDTLVYNHFLQLAAGELGLSPDQVEAELGVIDRTRLRALARRAKEQLSTTEQYREVLFSEKFGPIDLEYSRTGFERLLEQSRLIEKSLAAVKQACQLAYAFENARHGMLLDYPDIIKHDLQDACHYIDKVILVGGVTKIPYVRHQLEKTFPGKLVSESVIEPISAVAIGGAYPREPQHYSLIAPPYGFFLEGIDTVTGKSVKRVVFEPYEYLDFHVQWSHNARPAHMKSIDLGCDLKRAKLYYKLAGSTEIRLHHELGGLECGSWRFYITLDGDMFYLRVGERPRELKPYPIIHPIQQEIRTAKEKKLKKQIHIEGNYEDWIRSMMSEN